MVFDSLIFILFLPIVLVAYQLFKKQRKLVMLAASCFFYGCWNWYYLLLIAYSIIVDFFCAKKMEGQTEESKKKLFLCLSVCSNLSLLFFFKYFNFVNTQVDYFFEALGMDYLVPYSSFLLPMGISFYTFQAVAYTIDVYRGQIKAERNFISFALFVTFFPQLVAGPIQRAGHLLSQLTSMSGINSHDFVQGLGRVAFGLVKKLVIANRLALFVNQVYSDPGLYDGFILSLATVFFAFQIYCDFSGYSDIAIGVARMFGVHLIENFKNPYWSKNIKEFWAKWHISLSTWFRDYLYIPLGGNKTNKYRNLLLVFLVSGLWHGANLTFVVWGALHGILLVATVFCLPKFAFLQNKFFKGLGVTATFLFVNFCWIFFRAANFQDALLILRKLPHINILFLKDVLYQIKMGLLDYTTLSNSLNLEFGRINFQLSVGDLLISLGAIPLLVLLERYKEKFIYVYESSSNLSYLKIFLLAIVVLLFGVFGDNQFIYFQF